MKAARRSSRKRQNENNVLLASSAADDFAETTDYHEGTDWTPDSRNKFFSLDRLLPWTKPVSPLDESRPPNSFSRSSLDIYSRVSLLAPFRFRVKHTLAPLEQLKVKSEVSAGIRKAPEISLELKLLDCIKYRVASTGNVFQVRARTMLHTPHAELDIRYERKPGSVDAVRVGFLFRDIAYLKIPALCAGLKLQAKAGSRLKTTLRMKNNFSSPEQASILDEPEQRSRRPRHGRKRRESVPENRLDVTRREISKILRGSDMGMDIKVRCLDSG